MTVPRQWKGVGHDGSAGTFPGLSKAASSAWWYDWGLNGSRSPNYVPMSFHGTENIAAIVGDMPPGSYYQIFNEPDRPDQANISPVVAANRYFAQYNAIKYEDTTAKVGGIALTLIPSNGEVLYMIDFLTQLKWKNEHTGGRDAKLDFYTVHSYCTGGGALPLDGSKHATFGRLRKHLEWLHGHLAYYFSPIVTSSTPVWLTEVSVLHKDYDCSGEIDTEAKVISYYMNPLCSWLASWGFDTGKVARVAWFVTHWKWDGNPEPPYYPDFQGNLFDISLSTLTSVGEAWKEKEDNEMSINDYEFKQLIVSVTGSGSRYKDYVWNHGMGADPRGVVASIGMTGIGKFWGVNTYNPSSSQVRFRVFHVDGANWSDTLTLTALGWWA